MLEGGLAGLYVAQELGIFKNSIDEKIEDYKQALEEERRSEFSSGIRATLDEITVEDIEKVLK